MTKVFCDFCHKESKKMLQVKLPQYTQVDAYGGKDNVPLVRFSGDIIAADKDMCESCARKLIMAMGLVNNILFEENV